MLGLNVVHKSFREKQLLSPTNYLHVHVHVQNSESV